jgi:hypothetical protein
MHYSEIDKGDRVGVQQTGGPANRRVYLRNVEEVDGTDELVPCPPGSSEGKSVKMTEEQTLDLFRDLERVVKFWAAQDAS